MPGPARIPTALKLLEGNPGHQKLNLNEPKPSPIMPEYPRWLDTMARREWKRCGPILFKLGLLVREDMAQFSMYCHNYSIVVQCAKMIKSARLVTKDGKKLKGITAYLYEKNSQTIPELTAMNKAQQMCKSICAEFGMTPSARGRMVIQPNDDNGDEDLD